MAMGLKDRWKQSIKMVRPMLKKVYGRTWFRRVRVSRLDMMNPCNCILGQLEGLAGDYEGSSESPYHRGLRRLGLHPATVSNLKERGAFVAPDHLWIDVIRDLRRRERDRA